MNGDGYADVIVGAYGYDAGETDEGAAFVFHGNSFGRPVLARQRRGDGSGVLVQPSGWSRAADALTIEMVATHPEGRGKVKAEFELCPHGVAFGAVSCVGDDPHLDRHQPGRRRVLPQLHRSGVHAAPLARPRAARALLDRPARVTAPGLPAPRTVAPPHRSGV